MVVGIRGSGDSIKKTEKDYIYMEITMGLMRANGEIINDMEKE